MIKPCSLIPFEALTFNLCHLSDLTGPRGLESEANLLEIMELEHLIALSL